MPPKEPAGPITVKAAWDAPALETLVKGGTATESDGAEIDVDLRQGGTAPQRFYATVPVLALRPTGGRCMQFVRRAFPDAQSAAAATAAADTYVWRITEGGFLPCQDARTPSEPTPAQQAFDYWRVVGRDLLPKPAPKIAPGYMLAGKMAFLETGSQPTARFEHPTPAGTLVIEATSRLWVDWGDSSGLEGPHVGPGAPWPHGTITHFWTTAATYDVRVVQRWTATWTLGAATGTLDGLETEGVIDDFEVRQLQAVRNS